MIQVNNDVELCHTNEEHDVEMLECLRYNVVMHYNP